MAIINNGNNLPIGKLHFALAKLHLYNKLHFRCANTSLTYTRIYNKEERQVSGFLFLLNLKKSFEKYLTIPILHNIISISVN